MQKNIIRRSILAGSLFPSGIISFGYTILRTDMSFSWIAVKDILGWVKIFALQPKLKLYFDPTKTYHIVPDLAWGRLNGMFVHVMLINSGRNTAKKCTALLTEVHEETGSGAYLAA